MPKHWPLISGHALKAETSIRPELTDMTLSKHVYEHYEATDFPSGVPDTLINVTLLDGSPGQWLISQNLTCSDGEINDYEAEQKPLFELLNQPDMLEALRAQMIDEITFISRKDGTFGVLFEIERECQESDGVPPLPGCQYADREDVVENLLEKLNAKVHCFPSVQFCIPCPSQVYKDRVGVWAFVPNGALHEDALDELADLMNHL
jgi:hypothetical protein